MTTAASASPSVIAGSVSERSPDDALFRRNVPEIGSHRERDPEQ